MSSTPTFRPLPIVTDPISESPLPSSHYRPHVSPVHHCVSLPRDFETDSRFVASHPHHVFAHAFVSPISICHFCFPKDDGTTTISQPLHWQDQYDKTKEGKCHLCKDDIPGRRIGLDVWRIPHRLRCDTRRRFRDMAGLETGIVFKGHSSESELIIGFLVFSSIVNVNTCGIGGVRVCARE